MKKASCVVLTIAGLMALAGVAAALCCFTVSEGEYAVVTRFGDPRASIVRPGLYFKAPGFIDKANRFDGRIQVCTTQPIELYTGDHKPIIVTCYVCWKIEDPRVFFQRLNNFENATRKISELLTSQLGNVLTAYRQEEIFAVSGRTDAGPEAGTGKTGLAAIEGRILSSTNRRAREGDYGIGIVQVGVSRLAYPDSVTKDVYERMQTDRKKESVRIRGEGKEAVARIDAGRELEVRTIRAEAAKQAEIIRGTGEAEAMRISAAAYGRDEEFFKFLKSLDALKAILQRDCSLILSTDSGLFRYLELDTALRERED